MLSACPTVTNALRFRALRIPSIVATLVQQFNLKYPDGTERGPFTADELQDLAQRGMLPAGCELQSTLVRNWRKPEEYSFLRGLIQTVPDEKKSSPEVRGGRVDGSGAGLPQHAQSRLFVFTPASGLLRLLAGLTDLLGLLLLWGVLRLVWGWVIGDAGMACFVALCYAGSLVYLTGSLAGYAQTAGHWFWGIMIIGHDGDQVMFDRAFRFALVATWCGLLTPMLVFVLPSRRALPDLLSGTRMVRTRVVYEG